MLFAADDGSRWPQGHNWTKSTAQPEKSEGFPIDGCFGLCVLVGIWALAVFFFRKAKEVRQLRQSPEYQSQRRAERELSELTDKVAAARRHVERFYRQHAELLRDEYPPELFEATVAVRFPAGVSIEQAWREAQSLIEELQPLVAAATSRRKARSERVRRIDLEIEACRARMERFQSSDLEPDTIADEVKGAKARIKQLEEEKEMLGEL